MKKLLMLALVLSLMAMVSANAMAAVHGLFDDFVSPVGSNQFSGLSWGGWYSIDKDSPYVTARVLSEEDSSGFGVEYYQNDFFHGNISYINDTTPWDYRIITLKGSYLFDSGLFIGLDYSDVTNDFWWDYTQPIISPGFRFELGDGGYAAISVDYCLTDEGWNDSGILGYDIDFKYFTDNAKIYGGLYVPNDDVAYFVEDTIQYLLAINYKVSDELTVGGYYNGNTKFSDHGEYNIGATYNLDQLMLELSYTDTTEDSDSTLALNGIYTIDKFKFGLQYTKVDSDENGVIDLKFHYSINDKSNIRVVYQLENEDDFYPATIFVRWTQDL